MAGGEGGCIPHPPGFAPACTDNNVSYHYSNQLVLLQYDVRQILSQLFCNNRTYCTCTVCGHLLLPELDICAKSLHRNKSACTLLAPQLFWPFLAQSASTLLFISFSLTQYN